MCAGGLRTHLTEADTVKGVEALRSWGVRDAQYREIVLAPLRTAMEYQPKMGTGSAVSLPDFIDLYSTDPLYHWMGLDNELMYLAAKAGGGQTSIYRHLGDGYRKGNLYLVSAVSNCYEYVNFLDLPIRRTASTNALIGAAPAPIRFAP